LACPNFRDPEIAVANNTHTPVIKREPWRLTPQYIRPTVHSHMSYLKNYQEKACPELALHQTSGIALWKYYIISGF
jgi:hypothetical protein